MPAQEIPTEIKDRYTWETENFDKYILQLHEHCLNTKEQFLKIEPFSLTNNISGVNYLTGVYFNTTFFPDQDIYNKFLDFGIKQKDLKWMNLLHEIVIEFSRLENSGIIVYRLEFLKHLMVHLSAQISQDVLSWAEMSSPHNKSNNEITLTSEIENAMGRLEYDAKRVYQPTRKKEILNAIAKEIKEVETNANLRPGIILRFMKGQITKEFFVEWLRLSFPYSDKVLKSNKFLLFILPMFRIILKENKSKEIPELDDIKTDEYKGKSIETIQAQTLRKWIFKS